MGWLEIDVDVNVDVDDRDRGDKDEREEGGDRAWERDISDVNAPINGMSEQWSILVCSNISPFVFSHRCSVGRYETRT